MRARRILSSVAVMNCLATTGTDAVLPFLIGALLICAGIVVAAIAVRRKRAGLALAIVLLLGLGAGAGSLLGAPAPAQAACVSDPGAPGGGTPCTPATAIAGVTGTSRAEWAAGDPTGSTDLPLNAASALAWQSALDAINALGTPTFANGNLEGADATNTESVVISESGFTGTSGEVPTNAVYVHTTDFASATQGLIDPAVTVSFDLQYPDGCGGTLTTHFTASGAFTNTVPCVPAAKVADFTVGSASQLWNQHSAPAVTELDFTPADQTLWTTKIAAITAIDSTAVKTGGTLTYGANTFSETPNYNPTLQALLINTSSYQAVVGNGSGGTMVATFEYDYNDGCGGALVTHVTAIGGVPQIIP
jgi:hypothetical protein